MGSNPTFGSFLLPLSLEKASAAFLGHVNDVLLSPTGTAVALFERRQDDAIVTMRDQLREHLQIAIADYNLPPHFVQLAEEITSLQPELLEPEQQALLLLTLCALISVQQGSTQLEVGAKVGEAGGHLSDLLHTLLAEFEPDTHQPLSPHQTSRSIRQLLENGRCAEVVGSPGDHKPLVYNPPFVSLERIGRLEEAFTDAIKALAEAPANRKEQSVDQAVQDVLEHPLMNRGETLLLNDRQIEAVRRAACNRLTIVTGGPGTGKTTVVVSILRVLARLGVPANDVALAAPTGKAAYRMSESVHSALALMTQNVSPADERLHRLSEARTLHRLLGFSPKTGRFSHHHNNPLSESVVVVDEASMIDLELMHHLVRALREDASLILLGDSEQLPSVKAGAVLRDLTQPDARRLGTLAGNVVTLTKSMRMDPTNPDGRNILVVAQRINAGDANLMAAAESPAQEGAARRTSARNLNFRGVEFLCCDSESSLAAFLDRWREQFWQADRLTHLRNRQYTLKQDCFDKTESELIAELFSLLGRSRLLCLTNRMRRGVERINGEFHRRTLPAGKARSIEFGAGEPVLMLVNDYERQLFNGDQGVVLRVKEDSSRPVLTAVFPRADGFAAHGLSSLAGKIQLSYATTVHKSQGSEFDHVAMLLPDRDLPLNTREILYTAVTRSKKSAILVGDEAILGAGVSRQIQRSTGIAARLARR